ncbi:hypothetical protein [Nonomuraea sp. NPDC003201]
MPLWHIQYARLVPLAWNLHTVGLAVALQLPAKDEPVLVIARASGLLKVRVAACGAGWVFTWGRGLDHCVDTDALERATQILAGLAA